MLKLDTATVEVIRNASIYIAEEMGVVLRNTALSPNIRDRLDHSCAILDAEGNLVAQAEHIPVHLGSMSVAARNIVEWLERNGVTLDEGDVVVSNDPYIVGTHLNDLMLLKPVYAEGRLLGYVAAKAHHVDIGGGVPGSLSPNAKSLIEEGLVIPPVKLVVRGELRRDILRLLEANVRTPRYLRGDLLAQIAAVNVGERRLRELVDRYGASIVMEAWKRTLDYTERYARNRIRALVEKYGVYGKVFTAEDYLELGSGPARIRVSILFSGGSITVDFAGSNRQVDEPFNAVYGVTVAATTFALKAVIDPEMPMNQGFYRVVNIAAPRGTIVNPEPPAPVGGGNVETSQRIVDVVLRALADAFPDRVPAASCGTMTNVALGGRGWAFYETVGCGSGARPCCDGVDGVHTNMTNTLNTPIEVAEAEYPILFLAYELRPNSGGSGKYRGGLGIIRAFTVLEDGVKLSIIGERVRLRPWGLRGGGKGAPARFIIVRRDGRVELLESKASVELHRGDRVYIATPGGGGYGDSCSRDRELVRRDLEDGKITQWHARRYYCYETE
ncbi:hydantoinase B/oxoprolinase family protein [Hyperthermus butylicus]|uniref:hydantoinase B/oxoprolinase family protein n=1 Tax=Hyperthermus butylicus TaxID=54248 RepID=UPI003B83431B